MTGIIALSLLALAVGFDQREEAVPVLRHWVALVEAHEPGEVDQPLLDLAAQSGHDLDLVRRTIRPATDLVFASVDDRNAVIRRGALAHMDVALLLPRQAAAFTQRGELARDQLADRLATTRAPVRLEADALVHSIDGEFVDTSVETAHWSMARALLGGIEPHPSADPFVARWYRAVAANFQVAYLLGNARYHLDYALGILPKDPVLLLYAGAMHEAYASPRIQSIPATRPALARQLNLPSPRDEWRRAEDRLRASIKAGGSVEARVRLGRVVGQLGRHDEAISILQAVEPGLAEPRLQYLAALFLGTEHAALRHGDVARRHFERAAQLCPTAQSPWLALSELFRSQGNRAAALEALQRVQALPEDRDILDPWIDYFRSYALDADDQLAALRAWPKGRGPR